ncbi:hypothetical protein [Microbacterium sp. ZXX196]|uniref:hypothetical protein n=1 Tax=Microbacterium sp. ZXX196 TaxID=2609291 RepID=UPI0012B726F4|nr:hypothetical protein [Microbacterium sp. ZXX196]MTE24830.1 hypothetical protein [Microbacterium sp. ZXX196]
MTVRVKINLKGLNELMTSKPVQDLVEERARKIQEAAGPNFEVVSRPHRWVARAFVQPANSTGAAEEAREKKLTGALSAGR